MPEAESEISIVITTSAIPLNPSTKLIDVLLESMVTHLEDIAEKRIPVYILCDGYSYSEILTLEEGSNKKPKQPKKHSYKKARITLQEASNYAEFIGRLRSKYEVSERGDNEEERRKNINPSNDNVKSTQSADGDENVEKIRKRFKIAVIELGRKESWDNTIPATNLGFANAVRFAVEHLIKTPLVMVAQHDYVLVQSFPFKKVVSMMLSNKRLQKKGTAGEIEAIEEAVDEKNKSLEIIDYVGFDSLTTIDYIYKVQREVGKDLDARTFDGLEFLPLYIWYDKTHICRVDAYKRLFAISDANSAQNADKSKKGPNQDEHDDHRNDGNWSHLHFPLGSFIEDVFFNNKIDSFPRFSSYVLQQYIGPVIYHLSGRKLQEKSGDVKSEGVTDVSGEQTPKHRSNDPSHQEAVSSSSKIVHLGNLNVGSPIGFGTGFAVNTYTVGSQLPETDIPLGDLSSFSIGETTIGRGEGVRHPFYSKSAAIGSKFDMFKQMPKQNLNKNFTGTCYKCGQKGHSAQNCPLS